MKRIHSLGSLALMAALVAAPDCVRAADHHAATPAPTQAVAVLQAASGSKVGGVVKFTQSGDSVKVVATISGLTPGQKHAMHVHQFGDATAADAMSTGGHYNPEGHDHGLPDKDKRHAGDLGNVTADAEGKATYEITVKNISVAGHVNPILGRAVIVHAKTDDGGQPVGNAGARIAVGVIGIANTTVAK